MKIAIVYDMIYPFSIGGAELRNYEIAKRLAKNNDIHIYGVKLWNGPNIIKRDNITIHGVCRYKNKYNFLGKRTILEPIWFALKLFPELLKEKFDIIDTSSFVYFHCFPLKLASLIKKTPLILTWHQYWDDYWYEYLGNLKGAIGKLIEYSVSKLSKFNIAVSHTVKKDLIAHKMKEKNIFVNYNGISLKEIGQIKKENIKYDLVTVARLTHQKNIGLLLNSLAILKKQLPKIRLAIVGDGPDKKNLLNQVKSKNLDKNVIFFGFLNNRSEVYKIIKSSRLFVLPSILEGFGIVIIEANACRIPAMVIESKWNASSLELIRDKRLIAKNNPEDLANKIKNLLLDNKTRNNLAKNSLVFSNKFDWDNITKELERYYERIIANN